MSRTAVLLLLSFALATVARAQAAPEAGVPEPIRYVIHVSVDGLRPDAVTRQGARRVPNFYRLRREGAFTDNARTDADYSNTLPNHLAQLTGRPVLGDAGHAWTSNTDPAPGATVHGRRDAYVASVFDVVHDHGLPTAAFVSKSKFALLDASWGPEHGAPDTTGADDGRDKLDRFVYEADTDDLVERFVDAMREEPAAYSFVHLRDPDSHGHKWGWRLWSWHPYTRAVRRADDRLGAIFDLVDRDPRLKGRTAIILTADHGGSGHSHGAGSRAHYTVPLYVWGPGIPAGADLYALNADRRLDPGAARPGFEAAVPPIRNGGAANLALSLLGLAPVPGSTINAEDGLRVRSHPAFPVEVLHTHP